MGLLQDLVDTTDRFSWNSTAKDHISHCGGSCLTHLLLQQAVILPQVLYYICQQYSATLGHHHQQPVFVWWILPEDWHRVNPQLCVQQVLKLPLYQRTSNLCSQEGPENCSAGLACLMVNWMNVSSNSTDYISVDVTRTFYRGTFT